MEIEDTLNNVSENKKKQSCDKDLNQNYEYKNLVTVPEDNPIYISKEILEYDSDYSTDENDQLLEDICKQNQILCNEFKNIIGSKHRENTFINLDNNSSDDHNNGSHPNSVIQMSLKDNFLFEDNERKRQLFLQQKSPLKKNLLSNEERCKSDSSLKNQLNDVHSFMLPTISSKNRSLKTSLDFINKQILHIGNTSIITDVCSEKDIRENETSNVDISDVHQCNNNIIDVNSLRSVSDIKINCNKLRKNGRWTLPKHEKNEICHSLEKLQSKNWDITLQGLIAIVNFSQYEGKKKMLLTDMDIIYHRLIELLQSPRIYVGKIACQLAGKLFETMKYVKRPEFDDVVSMLLQRTGDFSKVIREDANISLDIMITHIPITHSVRALCNAGPHRNSLVRIATVRLLVCIVTLMGPEIILNEHLEIKRSILRCLPIYLNDKCREARNFGIRLYKILSKHSEFDVHLKSALDSDERIKLESIVKKL